MATDPLAGAAWECCATPAGDVTSPADLDLSPRQWYPATVPGTVAAALRAAGQWSPGDPEDFDRSDWWFRAAFPSPGGRWRMELDGLATVADVWLNGAPVLHSDGMFTAHAIDGVDLDATNRLAIRFASLTQHLSGRRPRPRWRTRLVDNQHLRFARTALIGRMPGWAGSGAAVGPWRPIRLRSLAEPLLLDASVASTCEGSAGRVDIEVALHGIDPAADAELVVGDARARVNLERAAAGAVARGTVIVEGAARWWPHTHGDASLHAVRLRAGDQEFELGRTGFRTVAFDAGWNLVVNDRRVFCRGVIWTPPDAAALAAPGPIVRTQLERVRDAGFNMVRLAGTMVYESTEFWDLCDELGILVWQDCMFANMDPPEDDAFVESVTAELDGVLHRLAHRPSLAVVCGGSEVEQQASMLGLPPERRRIPLFETHIPAVARRWVPGVPYVTSSPTGGTLPFRSDEGVSHYFGVGAYRRPLADARLAGVRFTSECLAFAVPPERAAVEEWFGAGLVAGHDPRWKRGVPRDASAPWDFEDVRDHYVEELFGVHAAAVRATDPERYLDLGRATVAESMVAALGEWRRAASPCGGALILLLRDLYPGAGFGLLDAAGRPKAPWFALRRALQPAALHFADEGLNGLRLHVFDDRGDIGSGAVTIELFNREGLCLEATEVAVDSAAEIDVEGAFAGFRDLTYAYRFGPPVYDAIVATMGEASAVYIPGGPSRPIEADVGLSAVASQADGDWVLDVSTVRFAQWVAIDVEGYEPEDSWFHLPPGKHRRLRLVPSGPAAGAISGEVRALNAAAPVRISRDG